MSAGKLLLYMAVSNGLGSLINSQNVGILRLILHAEQVFIGIAMILDHLSKRLVAGKTHTHIKSIRYSTLGIH